MKKQVIRFWLLSLLCLNTYAVEQTILHPFLLPQTPLMDTRLPNPPQGGELRLGAVGNFDTLNPMLDVGNPSQYGLLMIGTLFAMVEEDPATQYPYVARSYEISSDEKSMIVHLNPKARFHDNSLVTSEDVVWSLEMMKTKGAAQFRVYFLDIERATVLSKDSVKFEFKTANKELPSLVGQIPIFSKKHYAKKSFLDPNDLPMSVGPYRVEKFTKGRQLILKKVSHWWGASLEVFKGLYNVERIRVEYFRDDLTAFEAFKRHELDIRIENKEDAWLKEYKFPAVKKGDVKRVALKKMINHGLAGIFFNTRKAPFHDPHVREALVLLFDFEWLNKNLFHNAYTRNKSTFMNTGFGAKGAPSKKECKYLEGLGPIQKLILEEAPPLPKSDGQYNRRNMERALALLKTAGWKRVNGQLRHEKTKEPFKLTIILPSNVYVRPLGHYITALNKLGIQASLQVLDAAQFTKRMHELDFDMAPVHQHPIIFPGAEQRALWHSQTANMPATTNVAGVKDPRIDSLIEKLLNAKDLEEIRVIASVLDRMLLWGHYFIPYWARDNVYVAYWNNVAFPPRQKEKGIQLMAWWANPQKHGRA